MFYVKSITEFIEGFQIAGILLVCLVRSILNSSCPKTEREYIYRVPNSWLISEKV